MASRAIAAYDLIIEKIFFEHFKKGERHFEFIRREIIEAGDELAPELDLNPGDVVYAFRYRRVLPESITATQPPGFEWIIEGAGRAKYRFKLADVQRIEPRADLVRITIPDATPELIRGYARDEEQALLAIVRYNRLVDTFLGLTTYSLQSHLRTYVKGVGQIEIDELYVGLDKRGCHYLIPVQAKGGKDKIGAVQTAQDIGFVEQEFPGLRCRAISAQFMADGVVALFELTLQDSRVRIVDEKHYRLVPAKQVDVKTISDYLA